MKIDRIRWAWLALLSGLVVATGAAQTKRTTQTDMELFSDKEKLSGITPSLTAPRGPALESTISPENYFVGPSDGFSVNIWTSPPLAFQLVVTPEGSLIVPTVGEIRVADMTLAAAKKKVLDEINKRYIRGGASVTLVTPRPILVTVRGLVLTEGTFAMAAYNRANRAVDEANKLNPMYSAEYLESLLKRMSTRRITVRHKDGTQTRVDVPKFLATKDDRWNPYLREGDVIVVPQNDFGKNVIGVYGAVNAPGRYEYAEGDSVKDALRIAYGFGPKAEVDSIEFSRQNLDGEIITRKIINGRAIMAGTEPDFPLQPGDRLLVRGGIDRRGDYRVAVNGEVVYPGTYPITRNSTHLADVIRAAGGFTESASLTSADVQRQSVAPSDMEMERLESLRGGVAPDDSSYYYLETNLRIRKEVVNADFVKLFAQGDSSQNILLQDEDIVNVPPRKKTIYVFGQVVSPGHVPFTPGQDVWYYVNKAGGLTERSRRGDLKVVKAKTKQWLTPDETTVEEGDYVWVPKDPEHPFGYYLGVVAQSAVVVSAAVSIVLLIIQVNK